MQLLHGKTLREHLAEGATRLTDPAGLDIAILVASGLEAAHEQGIIHRDIKPANVFITKRGHAKILDFGLAKVNFVERPGQPAEAAKATTITAIDEHLTGRGIAGTVTYMSPEQALGKKLDARTDLFSIGVVLYEMATGKLPFRGDTLAAQIDAILHEVPVEPVRLNSEIPAKLEEIIDKCLAKDPAHRYQTAQELGGGLEAVVDAATHSGSTSWWTLEELVLGNDCCECLDSAWCVPLAEDQEHAARRKPVDSFVGCPAADESLPRFRAGVFCRRHDRVADYRTFPKLVR